MRTALRITAPVPVPVSHPEPQSFIYLCESSSSFYVTKLDLWFQPLLLKNVFRFLDPIPVQPPGAALFLLVPYSEVTMVGVRITSVMLWNSRVMDCPFWSGSSKTLSKPSFRVRPHKFINGRIRTFKTRIRLSCLI